MAGKLSAVSGQLAISLRLDAVFVARAGSDQLGYAAMRSTSF